MHEFASNCEYFFQLQWAIMCMHDRVPYQIYIEYIFDLIAKRDGEMKERHLFVAVNNSRKSATYLFAGSQKVNISCAS